MNDIVGLLDGDNQEDVVQSTMLEIVLFLLFTFLFLMGAVVHEIKVNSVISKENVDEAVNSLSRESPSIAGATGVFRRTDYEFLIGIDVENATRWELEEYYYELLDYTDALLAEYREFELEPKRTNSQKNWSPIFALESQFETQDEQFNFSYFNQNRSPNCLPKYLEDDDIHIANMKLTSEGNVEIKRRDNYMNSDSMFPNSDGDSYLKIFGNSGISDLMGKEITIKDAYRLLKKMTQRTRNQGQNKCTFLFLISIEKDVSQKDFFTFKDLVAKIVQFSNPGVYDRFEKLIR